MSKDTSVGPKHVAIIMDGNGRWAQMRGRPRLMGHHAGARRVREIVFNNICVFHRKLETNTN
jgi:undecaprenyl diphosphate synthase